MFGTGDTHPLIVLLHGFGNDKHEWESTSDVADGADKYHWNNHWLAAHGYYVLTYTARGFRDNGPRASYQPSRATSLPGRGQGRSSGRALHLVPVREGWQVYNCQTRRSAPTAERRRLSHAAAPDHFAPNSASTSTKSRLDGEVGWPWPASTTALISSTVLRSSVAKV
ncbi:hypothetical protein GCM10027259_60160 [Micromonospora palomenae]